MNWRLRDYLEGQFRNPLETVLVEGERKCEAIRSFEWQNRTYNPISVGPYLSSNLLTSR
jgi:hypothetical protein